MVTDNKLYKAHCKYPRAVLAPIIFNIKRDKAKERTIIANI